MRAPPLECSPMPEDISNSVAYLLAMKRYTESSVDGAIPGVDVGQSGTAAAAARKPEHRRSPRYTCQGSVELRERDSDMRTWAHVTDISLHGCYIEVTATYPVGTQLHLKLDVSGYQIHSDGAVRVTYPLLGMGIAFSAISAENGSRLRQLLYSLAEPFCIQKPVGNVSRPEIETGAITSVGGPEALLKELVSFFQTRAMMTREEFQFLVRKTRAL